MQATRIRRHTSTNRNRFSLAQPYSCMLYTCCGGFARVTQPRDPHTAQDGWRFPWNLPMLRFFFLFLLSTRSLLLEGIAFDTHRAPKIDRFRGRVVVRLHWSLAQVFYPRCIVTDKKINFPSFVRSFFCTRFVRFSLAWG